MTTLAHVCKEQYGMIKSSRSVLLTYCGTISPHDLTDTNTSFGRGGSIRNLLVHMANVYEFWIGQQVLKKEIAFTAYESIESMEDIRRLFDTVNLLMDEFIGAMDSPAMQEITYELNRQSHTTSASRIFTHVITHEFHHKGQVLSLSRHLGYTPVDTDVIR